MLVSANDRAIDADLAEIPALGELREDPLPNPRHRPTRESLVDAIPGTENGREVSPRDAGSGHKDHSVDEEAIVGGMSTGVSRLAG